MLLSQSAFAFLAEADRGSLRGKIGSPVEGQPHGWEQVGPHSLRAYGCSVRMAFYVQFLAVRLCSVLPNGPSICTRGWSRRSRSGSVLFVDSSAYGASRWENRFKLIAVSQPWATDPTLGSSPKCQSPGHKPGLIAFQSAKSESAAALLDRLTRRELGMLWVSCATLPCAKRRSANCGSCAICSTIPMTLRACRGIPPALRRGYETGALPDVRPWPRGENRPQIAAPWPDRDKTRSSICLVPAVISSNVARRPAPSLIS
jgi:hypothetical protein